jgi:hypothetical protein
MVASVAVPGIRENPDFFAAACPRVPHTRSVSFSARRQHAGEHRPNWLRLQSPIRGGLRLRQLDLLNPPHDPRIDSEKQARLWNSLASAEAARAMRIDATEEEAGQSASSLSWFPQLCDGGCVRLFG